MTGRRAGLRWLAAAAAGAVLAILPASAGWAHGAHSPTATNYRTEVTAVVPAVEGVAVRTVEAGTALELTNHTGTPVQVLGYDGEPYLEVGPQGWYANTRSPATYLNQDYTGAAPVPEHADPRAEPRWRRVESGPVARWYDHRTQWMESRAPPQVAADPGTPQRVRDWTVPMRHEGNDLTVTGTLDWVPPPPAWPWWAGAGLLTAAVAALGLAGRARPARLLVAAVLVAGGACAVTYAVARELDAGAGSAGQLLGWLVTGALWPTLAALAALAAGGYLLVASLRPADPGEGPVVAAALAGACLAVFAGFADVAVFARSVTPVPFDPVLARVSVLATLAAGAGTAAAAGLTLRAQQGRS